MSARRPVAIIAPVYRNSETLDELVDRVRNSVEGQWCIRLVIDGCPDHSEVEALRLAEADPRVRVTVLSANVGQHRAIATGLRNEPDASAWVVLDADLQDPPEAIPGLVAALTAEHEGANGRAVFAGRQGRYENSLRTLSGRGHRAMMGLLTTLPRDAGAYVVMDRTARDSVIARVLDEAAPSVVAALMDARTSSVPVRRDVRHVGRSTWTPINRASQSFRTLAWTIPRAVRQHDGTVAGQLVRFLAVGGAATVGYLALYALLRFVAAPEVANVLSRVVFAIVTTWLNARLTFKSHAGLGQVILVGAAGLLVGIVVSDIPIALEQLLLPGNRVAEIIVILVATILATIARFALFRFAFSRQRDASLPLVPTTRLARLEGNSV